MSAALSQIVGTRVWNYAPLALMALSAVLVVLNQLDLIGRHSLASVADSQSEDQIRTNPEKDRPYIKTDIALQFFGDNRMPQEASSHNVAVWYAYRSSELTLSGHDASGNKLPGGMLVPPSWAIFIVFDKPIHYRQGIASFSNPEISPMLEVKQPTTRSMLVITAGQVPAGIIQIHAEP